jgi:hypothetical protein
MTPTKNHIEDVLRSQEAFEQLVKERLPYAIRTALIYAIIRSLKFNKITMPSASQTQPDPKLLAQLLTYCPMSETHQTL